MAIDMRTGTSGHPLEPETHDLDSTTYSGGSWQGRSWLRGLRPGNIGAVYVLIVICIIFAIAAPTTFPTIATVRQVLDGNAISAIAALALVVPLSTHTFDLSFAYVMSLSGVTAAHFVVYNHMAVPVAMLLGIVAALAMGVINGIVIVGMKIESLIATLATGSLVQAFITFFTNGISINNVALAGGFSKLGQGSISGITYPVIYAFVIAILIWLFMEYTPTGRRLYATGFNFEAARLANIKVNRLRFASLLVSATVAGFAGIVLASSLSAGSPSSGTPYLLPAFAAVFVGATQFKNGRFNAWGTVVAVLMIGTGTVGLGLASAPAWSSDMFTGVVLIAALGFAGVKGRSSGGGTLPVPAWLVTGLQRLRRGNGRVGDDHG